jgi:hypothetical protein
LVFYATFNNISVRVRVRVRVFNTIFNITRKENLKIKKKIDNKI